MIGEYTSTICVLIVVFVLQVDLCSSFQYPAKCDFFQDLSDDATVTPSMHCRGRRKPCVMWHDDLSGPFSTSGNQACSRQGVLSVTRGKKDTGISIYIGLSNPMEWSFNIGDSRTNNGYGGDAGTSNGWAAEIHNRNQGLLIYENVAWKKIGPPVPQHFFRDYFSPAGLDTTLNVNISTCNRFEMTTIPYIPRTHIRMTNNHMFEFDTLYIGLNRVISSFGRSGTGACGICINFETDVPMPSTCDQPGSDYKKC